jgi:hypothetical protein
MSAACQKSSPGCLLHREANPLQRQQGAVSLVHVEDGRRQPQRFEKLHAADASRIS